MLRVPLSKKVDKKLPGMLLELETELSVRNGDGAYCYPPPSPLFPPFSFRCPLPFPPGSSASHIQQTSEESEIVLWYHLTKRIS